MRGGIVPPEIKEDLYGEWGDIGYNVCYDCLEGRSSLCGKPPVKKHLEKIAAFFGGDAAEHTFGCRGAKYAVMSAIRSLHLENDNFCDYVIVDPNCHYSTIIAAEMNELKTVEFPHSGYPEYTFGAEGYAEKIEQIKKETGKLPALAVVTHADPYYGNIPPIREIATTCKNYGVPVLLNAAYTGGVMPINIKELNVDFISLSAHKSMMSLGPIGYVVTTHEWADRVFRTSQAMPGWSGRTFGKKIPNIFGCSIGGMPLISSMMSLPFVEKRIVNWEDELKKINDFVDQIEDIGDMMLLGQRPHRHHLLHFETPRLWTVSNEKRDKGFYPAKFLINNGVVGLHKGMSKHIKFSVYGLTDEEREKVLNAFYDMAEVSRKQEN